MEIFIALTKYNTCQRHKVTAANGNYLLSMFPPRHNSVQHIYEEWDIPINVHR